MEPGVLALLGAVVTAVATYGAAAWRFSGKVGSSDAETLWAQSGRMFDAQTKRLEQLEQRVASLESDKSTLLVDNLALRERNLNCEREVATLTERADRLREENARLRTTIQRLGGFERGT